MIQGFICSGSEGLRRSVTSLVFLVVSIAGGYFTAVCAGMNLVDLSLNSLS